MWFECVNKIDFLKKLYKEIPDLKGIRIEKISIENGGSTLGLVFDLPDYPTNPPVKWLGCNTVSIEISFSCVSNFVMRSNCGTMYGDIEMKNQDNLINASIKGNIECSFKAECAIIQCINAYKITHNINMQIKRKMQERNNIKMN